MPDYEAPWIDCFGGAIPEDAVEGGQDFDGETIYVGRARMATDNGECLLPGKVVPSLNGCYVPLNGCEHKVDRYQALVQPAGGNVKFEWVPAMPNRIPPNAVIGGVDDKRQRLYIGKGTLDKDRADVVGKVQFSQRVCYVPYGNKEIPLKTYHILVANKRQDVLPVPHQNSIVVNRFGDFKFDKAENFNIGGPTNNYNHAKNV